MPLSSRASSVDVKVLLAHLEERGLHGATCSEEQVRLNIQSSIDSSFDIQECVMKRNQRRRIIPAPTWWGTGRVLNAELV